MCVVVFLPLLLLRVIIFTTQFIHQLVLDLEALLHCSTICLHVHVETEKPRPGRLALIRIRNGLKKEKRSTDWFFDSYSSGTDASPIPPSLPSSPLRTPLYVCINKKAGR